MVPERTRVLERMLARRRRLSETILSLDGQARWGARTPEDEARAYQELAAADASMVRLEAELERRVEAAREAEPRAVEAWAEANIELLEAYLGALDDERQGTEVFVAQEERRLWQEVRAGRAAFVRQNVHYVQADPRLYRSLFGFDPA